MKRYLKTTKMVDDGVALMVLNDSLVIPKDTVQLMLSLHTRQKYDENEFVQLYSMTTINEVRRINGLPPVPESKVEDWTPFKYIFLQNYITHNGSIRIRTKDGNRELKVLLKFWKNRRYEQYYFVPVTDLFNEIEVSEVSQILLED